MEARKEGDAEKYLLEAPFWFFPVIPSSGVQLVAGLGRNTTREEEEDEYPTSMITAQENASVLWIRDCYKIKLKITAPHHLDKIVLENLFECEVHLLWGSCDYLEVADCCQDVFVSIEEMSIPLIAVDNGDRITFSFPDTWGKESHPNCLFLTAGSTGIFAQIRGSRKRHRVPRGDHDITLQVAMRRGDDDDSMLRSVELLPAGCNSARERLVFIAKASAKATDASSEEERVQHRKELIKASPEVFNPLLAEDVLERGKKRSGHATEEELREIFDAPEVLKEKVAALAALIRQAKHVIAYTGAGVSTSGGIPDYRGPQGVWTLRDRGEARGGGKDLKQARPTPTHMALAEMVKKGLVRHIASTNLDGLHRRSGIAWENLSELHGNSFVEKCVDCGAVYERQEDVGGGNLDHSTGNLCDDEECMGDLQDNIINFGEFTERPVLDAARYHGVRADVALVLGTSMKVTAACYLPLEVLSRREVTPEGTQERTPGKLVIVNLQRTPFDRYAAIRIFAKCDEVIEMLAKELELEVSAA